MKVHEGEEGKKKTQLVWWNNHQEPSLLREWTISSGPIHSAAFYSAQDIKYSPAAGPLKGHDIFKGPAVHPQHERQHLSF